MKRLIVTLDTSELRNLISEVIEEKLSNISGEKNTIKENVKLISRIEVAELFGVSKTTIDKWRRYNILPPIIKISSRVFFNKNQIFELFDRKRSSSF